MYVKFNDFSKKIKIKYMLIFTGNAKSIRGLLIGSFVITLNVFGGSMIMVHYGSQIFKNSGSDIDPNLSGIILMSVQLIGAFVAVQFVDEYGRRVLMILSSVGSSFGYFVSGAYTFGIYQEWDLSVYNWIPIVALSTTLFCQSIGIIPLSYVIVTEVLPTKVNILLYNPQQC